MDAKKTGVIGVDWRPLAVVKLIQKPRMDTNEREETGVIGVDWRPLAVVKLIQKPRMDTNEREEDCSYSCRLVSIRGCSYSWSLSVDSRL
jgi:hypothetical protein